MFCDLRRLSRLASGWSGRFLAGPYQLEGEGLEWKPSSMDFKNSELIGIQNQDVVINLDGAMQAQKMIQDDFTTGFGRVALPPRHVLSS